jgi:hypothetical protein
MILEIREASWSAPVFWRFARSRNVREIPRELLCANDNMNCYTKPEIPSGLDFPRFFMES